MIQDKTLKQFRNNRSKGNWSIIIDILDIFIIFIFVLDYWYQYTDIYMRMVIYIYLYIIYIYIRILSTIFNIRMDLILSLELSPKIFILE